MLHITYRRLDVPMQSYRGNLKWVKMVISPRISRISRAISSRESAMRLTSLSAAAVDAALSLPHKRWNA